MKEHGVRSTFSQAPFEIEMHDNAGLISTGTAFNYFFEGKRYMITNYHNISGIDIFTKKNIDDTNKRIPLWIKLKTFKYFDKFHYSIMPHRMEIYEDTNGPFGPLWFEHPDLHSGCDVIAIENPVLDNEPEFMHNSVNLITKIKIPVVPGHAAFVVGFPHGISIGFGLPVWKSAYIASEPAFDIVLKRKTKNPDVCIDYRIPAFFIDGQTRPGMSGSPVFATYYGIWNSEAPYEAVDMNDPNFWTRSDIVMHHLGMEFAGIYSGRLFKREEDAALGLCWRRNIIEHICKAKTRGTEPYRITDPYSSWF